MAVGNGNRKEQFEQLDGVIAQWKGVEGGLLPIMQHAQEILGCVDEEVQHYISAATGIPVSTITAWQRFIPNLRLNPAESTQWAFALARRATCAAASRCWTSLKSGLA